MGNNQLVLGEELSEKLYIVLVDRPNNVRGDLRNDHAKYNVFGRNYLKVVVSVWGDLKKWKTEKPVICSSL